MTLAKVCQNIVLMVVPTAVTATIATTAYQRDEQRVLDEILAFVMTQNQSVYQCDYGIHGTHLSLEMAPTPRLHPADAGSAEVRVKALRPRAPRRCRRRCR